MVLLPVFAAILWFYVPLLRALEDLRPAVTQFFWHSVFRAAAAHVACLLALSLVFRRKAGPALVFWGASLIGFLAMGRFRFVLAFVLAGVAALLLAAVGAEVARAILPAQFRFWAVNLSFGILVSSVVGSALAAFHLFYWWSAALAMAPLVALTLSRFARERPGWSARMTGTLRGALGDWNLEKALALEGIFLLLVFALVGACAPETRSDAIRLYWPYVKLLRHFGGFVEMPFQWSYIVPQPGLTFAATVLTFFGPLAVRFSMVLVLLSLFGLCAGRSLLARPAATALAVVVASCPIVLWTAFSLYQDAFVSLVVLLLAVVCIEGRDAGSSRYWIGVGALAGLAWCAKFSTICYALPLLAWALVRGRSVGWRRSLGRFLGLGGAGALLVAAPWLFHSYDQSGNPVFPLANRFFPSPLWPEDLTLLGSKLLDQFHLAPGVAGALMAPIDLTFHTDRFVEGPAGFLGVAFPALIALSLAAAVKGRTRSRILIAAGLLGTALVWRSTGYIRYWLPGLWLTGAGVAGEIGNLFRGRASRILAVSIGIALLVLQVPFSMVAAWGDADGWPWKLYWGSVGEEAYLERTPGFRALRKMEQSRPSWPRFWYTGLESVGNVEGVPFMAELWEFGVHGATDLESMTRYIEKAKCDYWVVQADSKGARYLSDLGLAKRYWLPEKLFAADEAVKIYRLRPPPEPSALEQRSEPARYRAGSAGTPFELARNGGFEQGQATAPADWSLTGPAKRVLGGGAGGNEGAALEIQGGGSGAQTVPIPGGVRVVRLSQSIRAASPGPLEARLQVNWSTKTGAFLAADIEVVQAGPEWDRYSMISAVPPKAGRATVIVGLHHPAGTAFFDDVRLEGAADSLPFREDNLVHNGGFELGAGGAPKDWVTSGTVRWLGSGVPAKEGQRLLDVSPGGVAVQPFRVPPGIRALRLGEWIRSSRPGARAAARLQINWSDKDGRFLTTHIEVVETRDAWTHFETAAEVPGRAAHGTVYLTLHDTRAAAQFDAINLVIAR